MKKTIGLILFLVLATLAGAAQIQVQDNLSLKAGPTEPGESLSLVWVEAMVYPKLLKDERVISLGVRTASRVKRVEASFDFSPAKEVLASSDGMFWNNTYKLPKKTASGVHVVRYQISGAGGSIQRTVEFFIESPLSLANDQAERAKKEAAVTSTCTALSGNMSRVVLAGQKLTAISKVPWYKVIFDDGQEGWVSSTRVKEPTEEYYNAGYKAYKAGDFASAIHSYRNAVMVDPDFVKGYLWLAKSYAASGDLDSAADNIARALKLDERDLDSRIVANSLSQKYYAAGHALFRKGSYQESTANFRKAVDLKPNSTLSWIELGKSLNQLGFAAEARTAWKEALKYDPENRELYSLLNLKYAPEVAAKPAAADAVAPLLVNDSLKIVQQEKTKKGTAIESAIKSVVMMTRSLGTPIVEKGWQIRRQGEKFVVSYLCEQAGKALESFDWLVDVDTRQVLPNNDNARLLMSRW
jgi:tetratricopeptide (TPR) repeat protein